MIAASGRNWNGFVSVAFVFGHISSTVTTYNQDMQCHSFGVSEMDASTAHTVDGDSENGLANFAPSAPGVFKEMALEMDTVLLRKGDDSRRRRNPHSLRHGQIKVSPLPPHPQHAPTFFQLHRISVV